MNPEQQFLHKLFEEIVNRHMGIFHRIARMYGNDAESRNDLLQEMLMQVWRALPRYDPSRPVSTWIYRIGLNVAISSYRKQQRERQWILPLQDQDHALAEQSDPEQMAQIKLLEQFIAALKPLDKALMLLYLEGKSQKEISEILGISPSNVGTKVQRIKEQLREQFKAFQ